MGMSKYPSVVTLPEIEKPYPSLLEFLFKTFTNIPRGIWEDRIHAGKVLDHLGMAITLATAYAPGKRIFYFREVEHEPVIPFTETILFQNDELLVACKPHFLPVTPGGRYVHECLLNRLRLRQGIDDLTPLHRIDRETAGIVIFSVNKKTRSRYHELFACGKIEKTYFALCELHRPPQENHWVVENRIIRDEPRFRRKIVAGSVNARSHIQFLKINGNRAHFRLNPLTGKTHQLRLHMSGLGFKIINDKVYPTLQPETEDDYAQPLQLLAKQIQFQDPITGKHMQFSSERELLW